MSTKQKKIIVNALTLSRIVGAFFLPIVLACGDFKFFITFLAVLFATDFPDGMLARRWHVETMAGSLLDPLGDKVLAISCIISLVKWYPNMWWLVGLEAAICAVNVYRGLRCEEAKSALLGKIKTWVLSGTLVLGALNLFWPSIIDDVFSFFGVAGLVLTSDMVGGAIIITVTFQVLTLTLYLLKLWRGKKVVGEKKRKLKSIKDFLVRLFDEKAFCEDKNKSIVDIITQ